MFLSSLVVIRSILDPLAAQLLEVQLNNCTGFRSNKVNWIIPKGHLSKLVLKAESLLAMAVEIYSSLSLFQYFSSMLLSTLVLSRLPVNSSREIK